MPDDGGAIVLSLCSELGFGRVRSGDDSDANAIAE